METNDLHIVQVKGGGFMNLTAVDVTLQRGRNIIGGKNKGGKSGIMTLFEMFKGKAFMPDIPKTLDARKGAFEVSIGDKDRNVKYTVKYSFTEKTSQIKVFDAEGEAVAMDVLKDMLSPLLNPWGWFEDATATGKSAKPRHMDAIDILRPLMKMDFTPEEFLVGIGFAQDAHARTLMSTHDGDPCAFMDAMVKYIGEKRLEWKTKVEQWEGSQAQLEEEIPIDATGTEFVEVKELQAEQSMLHEQQIKGGQDLKQGEMMEDEVRKAEANLIAAKQNLEAFRKAHEDLQSDLHIGERLEEIKEEIEQIGETNKLAQKCLDLKEMDIKVKRGEDAITKATDLIADIREKRENLLATAKMPVKGLSIDGDIIMKNGLPLGQDSTAEGLEDAFLIALAKFEAATGGDDCLKTLIIPNASLMDTESREHMYALADKHGVQLILEMVMDENTGGVIFVDNGVALTEEEAG